MESIIVGLATNFVTASGRHAFRAIFSDDSLYLKIEAAYEKALKQWTTNKQIVGQERIWSQKRFEELVKQIANPHENSDIDKGTIELLKLFEIEIQKDQHLWNHIQGKTFRELIARQDRTEILIQQLKEEIDANKIDEFELIARARNLVDYQINKNIASGKYIPDTFLEVSKLKDHVRYFAHPNHFYAKILEEARRFNFDDMHRFCTINHEKLFDFDVFKENFDKTDSSEISSIGKNLHAYLAQKQDELHDGEHQSWRFSGKLSGRKDDLEFLTSRILLLTADAGRGKTTFLCDFTRNVLLKHGIPCLYMNGFEIDANNVASSFSSRLYNFNNYLFKDILNGFSDYCRTKKMPLIIIIDGLNENSGPQSFCRNLEVFLSEILNYDFVKVILTCRDEYYKHNYVNLTTNIQGVNQVCHMHSDLSEAQKTRIIDNYLTHFRVKAMLSENVSEELSRNFLLLRIFAEAFEGEDIAYVPTLYKDEIFQIYYDRMFAKIREKLTPVNDFAIVNETLIRKFIVSIVEYMCQNNTFSNIPLNKIVSISGIDTVVLARFLDENILLRRDIGTGDIFEGGEVLNFTYDEFRDFLIAKYLISVYARSADEFEKFVDTHTAERSVLTEGLTSFLFLLTKKQESNTLHEYLKTQDWYNSTFLNMIWCVKEEYVDESDIERIKSLFCSSNAEVIVSNLLYCGHWDRARCEKLNIHLLFELLNELDYDGLDECLYKYFDHHKEYYIEYIDDRSQLDRLCDHLEEHIADNEFMKNPESGNLFQFILYFLPISHRAYHTYGAYMDYMGSIAQAQARYLSLMCGSDTLKRHLNSICNNP